MPAHFTTQLKSFLILFFALFIAQTGIAKDPSLGRQEAMEQISEEDVANQSMRYKIIQSRMLILRMTDILPSKGNPYFHMADFAANVTQQAFNEAQATTSDFMESETPKYWLPVETGQVLDSQAMQDSQVEPVVKYFAQYVAIAELMENTIQPILKKSIIIGSVAQTAGADADQKFKKAWRYIQHYSGRYKALLMAHPGAAKEFAKQKKQVPLLILTALVKEMTPHLPRVETETNKSHISSFMKGLTEAADQQVSDDQFDSIKNEIVTLANTGTAQYQAVADALESVDLPDTGDIDGADEAFEIAMRLEVGFDVIQQLMNEIKETW